MADLAITNSEKFGKNEQIPTILLSEAVVADETVNMRVRYGEYRAVKGRLAELFDSEDEKIATPTDTYVITSIVSGTKTINITGDHSAGSTVLAVGATIRVNGGTVAGNNITFTVDTLPTTSSIVVVESISNHGATPGNVFVGATPIIEYHRHVRQANAAEFLLLATAYHIWLWNNTDKSLTLKFTSGSPGTAEHWSIVTHLDDVYATNNVDLVQKWTVSSSPSNNFEDAGSNQGIDVEDGTVLVVKARFIASFESYLFLFYVTYNTGDVFPLRTNFSARADPTDFNINSSGDAGLKNFDNTPDFLVGVGFWQNNMIVFKQERHLRGTLVTDDAVFTWDEEELKVGALSQHAIANDRAGRLYWLASDLTIREIRTPIDVSALVDKTIKNLNTSVAEFAQMTFIDPFGTINLALAIGSETTNNKIISFHPDTADSFILSIPVRAFGKYTRQAAFTYQNLPYATYDDWGSAWGVYDTGVAVVGFPLILAADYSGNTFDMYLAETDDGVAMTRALVFNTNLGAIFPFKRVNNGMYGLFRRQGSGQVLMYIRTTIESGWRLLGADGVMSLADSRGQEFVIVHLPFDERFQNAQFKAESTDRMEAVGFIFRDFEIEDDR
ncbi:hypothetical protein LCGC14_1365040 [marine sediment metagenome]|uniref:Uncharacterized protein n=1 Tax=marine sediment metagenome TaxID=412755 RepID=A0A0F9K719_9ZZZZ